MQDFIIILMLICGVLAILAFFGFTKAVLDYSDYKSGAMAKRCKHTFNTDEVINLKIDPKCTKCDTFLSQAN